MPTTSYWEDKWFKNYDFAVIGGGIVGCFTALKLIQEKPKEKLKTKVLLMSQRLFQK